MKAIIVDDEESARMTLRSILEGFFKEVTIIGEADSPQLAIQLIEKQKPDVVFLDIQMGSQSGFDVLESLSERKFQTIIVSAHKHHAYDSFRFKAVDYLLKPVRIKDLRAALEKVKENVKIVREVAGQALIRAVSEEQYRLQLVVPDFEGFSVIKLADIIRCEGSGNYADFILTGDRRVIGSKNLKDLEELLIPHGFFRIHRSHIINVYHVSRYVRGRGGEVVMSDDTILPVSRERKEPMMEVFLK